MTTCQIHDEENGERRPAVARWERYLGDGRYESVPVCADCRRDLAETAGHERHDRAVMAAATER